MAPPEPGDAVALEVDPDRDVALDGVADDDLVRRRVVVNPVVAVAVGQVAHHEVVVRARVEVEPGVLVGVRGVVDDRVVVAREDIDPRGIAHVAGGVGERDVVADRVVVGAVGQPDAVRAVVIGRVAADRGVRRAVDVDARPGRARGGLPALLTWLFEIVMWSEPKV